MGVPAGITIAFPGAIANIPPGWTRVTSLDARHTRGADAGVGGGATGGNSTHVHISDPHTHGSMPIHTHTFTDTTGPLPVGVGAVPGSGISSDAHTHAIGSATGADTDPGTAALWTAIDTDPAYYTVVWIQSDGTPAGIPGGTIAWWDNATIPANWTLHSASAGRYLRGAASGRSGGSNGGITQPHAHTATSHIHTGSGHRHTFGVTAEETQAVGAFSSPPTLVATSGHAHTLTNEYTTVVSDPVTSLSSGLGGTEPPFYTLFALTPIVVSATVGCIVLWNDTIASIPAGFSLCDGSGGTPDLRTRFVKNALTPAALNTTGGAVGHTHSSPSGHTHTNPSHNHALTVAAESDVSAQQNQTIGSGSAYWGHTHQDAPSSSDNSAAFTAVGTQDVQSIADDRPPYADVLYLQLTTVLAITLTTPTVNQVFPNDTPTFAWTIGGVPIQSAYRVLIYASNGITLVYDSGQVTSSTQSATIPLGSLHNLHNYYAQVGATDNAGHFGLSALVPFSIFMTQPPTLTITATPEPNALPPDVLLSWTPPTIAGGDTFDFYTVERRVTGTMSWITIAQINTYATVSYRDYTGAPNVSYDYAVTYTVTRTGDQVASAEQVSPQLATLSFIGIWIHVVQNPAIWLEYQANAEKLQPTQDQKIIPVWGRTRPTAHIGELFYEGLQFTGAPEFYPTTTWQAGLEQFVAATAAGQVLCVRMGQMQEVYFCVLDMANTSRADELAIYANNLAFTEINYEGAILQL